MDCLQPQKYLNDPLGTSERAVRLMSLLKPRPPSQPSPHAQESVEHLRVAHEARLWSVNGWIGTCRIGLSPFQARNHFVFRTIQHNSVIGDHNQTVNKIE